ncbi:unnamed protein product [Porites lobata]|uniref:YqaJ viral recombinase domain-containing protein n=1 Tax=Porites lobata TaxID=104759 RepID=A0ABN8R7B7_9CNID|nr:unnamed protein product [Porites lobata]
MYLVSHYSMTKAKMIPDDLVCTSLPQQWHRPRGKNISSEPLTEIIFKKPRLGTTCTGESTSVSVSPGITCSLYPAIKAAPTNAEIESFKDDLKKVNKNFGLSLYMNAGSEKVPTRAGLAPLGGYLSYQMAPTEGNFKVTCNVDLSKQPASSEDVPRTIYPSFPLSLVSPLFIVTQCSSEHNQFYENATDLERATQSQRNSSRWWTERKPRLAASTFGEILSRKSITSPFLKGLVSDQNAPVDSRNVPAPLKHGIENESRALKQYENYLVNSGHPVKTFPSGFVVNPAFPFLGCSPDGKAQAVPAGACAVTTACTVLTATTTATGSISTC